MSVGEIRLLKIRGIPQCTFLLSDERIVGGQINYYCLAGVTCMRVAPGQYDLLVPKGVSLKNTKLHFNILKLALNIYFSHCLFPVEYRPLYATRGHGANNHV